MRKYVVILMVLGLPLSALAGEGSFGQAGSIAPGGGISLSYLRTAPPDGGSASSAMDVTFAPGALYFVIDDLAVGANVMFSYTKVKQPDSSQTTLGIAPMVGYNVVLGEKVSLFVDVGVSYSWTKSSFEALSPNADIKAKTLTLLANAPLLVHFGNFYMGAGPAFQTALWSKVGDADASTSTQIGLTTMMGGWF